MRGFKLLLIIVAMLAPTSPGSAQQIDLRVEINKMLNAVGGREAWANATGFTMSEILYSDERELPVMRHYWVDFKSPRIMEKAEGRGLLQTRALNEDTGWTVRNGALSSWDEATVTGWKGFWPGIPTRIFHLLAIDDPGVTPVWRDGVIDIFIDGQRVVWIATDDAGTPVAYGRDERHTDTHFLGKPLDYGNVTLWSEAIEPGGDWRVVMIDYELLTDPHTVSFHPPK